MIVPAREREVSRARLESMSFSYYRVLVLYRGFILNKSINIVVFSLYFNSSQRCLIESRLFASGTYPKSDYF
jgi:hypothetical protein